MKKKINLDALKVKSFVTADDKNTTETVKGGREYVRTYRRCLPGDPTTDPIEPLSIDICSVNVPYECYTGATCFL